jgi:hypothetical protein
MAAIWFWVLIMGYLYLLRNKPQDDLAESIPGAARVQELLLPFVARRGDRRGPQLMRLHRWMNASLNV